MSTVIEGVEYGPLAQLVGEWSGDKGMDVSPDPDGEERSPYYETLNIEAAGTVDNAETQTLAVLRYHQVVRRKSNDEVFHDEVGYWMWDASDNTVMHSLAIPRGVVVLAGGKATKGDTTLNVDTTSDERWGVTQSPFMTDNAKTESYSQKVTVDGDTLRYMQTMVLSIYGKTFDHTDASTLKKSAS